MCTLPFIFSRCGNCHIQYLWLWPNNGFSSSWINIFYATIFTAPCRRCKLRTESIIQQSKEILTILMTNSEHHLYLTRENLGFCLMLWECWSIVCCTALWLKGTLWVASVTIHTNQGFEACLAVGLDRFYKLGSVHSAVPFRKQRQNTGHN